MNRIVPILLVALAVVAGAAYWVTQGNTEDVATTNSTTLIASNETSTDAAPAEDRGIVEMVLGQADAPIELIEYASFTCPHCATFHEQILKPLKADYVDTGKVKVVFRDVYFDQLGLWASMIARCGGEEKFFGITELLMKGQRDWARSGDPVAIVDELKKIGRIAGVDQEKLDACMRDEDKARALVEWSEANVSGHDIEGTPTMIINGEKHSNMSYADLKKILDAKLEG
ncbi:MULTISPECIES: DsbA family protein [Shimia]|uniref:DsbA family protein n=1 Tax=Shimia TaxID=573139 RepID=UPI001FB4F118|nr:MULTISPECIES: DsbA family protein [Shimia]MDV4144815.1 DsbA family protein [Shimia sp. FJ5]